MMNKLRTFCRSPSMRMRLIFICGAVGILLILLSEMLPDGGNEQESGECGTLTLAETSEYKESVEKELADIISQIKGAGMTEVMVTVEGTKEYIYAEQTDLNRTADSGGEDISEKKEIVIADEGSARQPILKKITVPKISGAVIICEGAEDAVTRERVMNAVTASLGLPSGRISIEPMK